MRFYLEKRGQLSVWNGVMYTTQIEFPILNGHTPRIICTIQGQTRQEMKWW